VGLIRQLKGNQFTIEAIGIEFTRVRIIGNTGRHGVGEILSVISIVLVIEARGIEGRSNV